MLHCKQLLLFSSVGIINKSIKPFQPIMITDLFYPLNQLPDGSTVNF